jgi:nitrate reductase gamma subunit
MNVYDILLFGAFPYVAVVMLVVISLQRYRANQFTISSLSSQFLEGRRLFWGSVPFHLGISIVFFGHLTGFLIPRSVQVFGTVPARLLLMELTGLVGALLLLTGLILLVVRRMRDPRLLAVTGPTDFVVYALLLFQALSGLYVALFLRWGTAWYVQVAVPYLRSLFLLRPDIQRMAELPLMARLHVLGAFTLFAVFSFTRLMHVLVAPVPYLWRSTQLVIWNRDRREVRLEGRP